VLYEEDFVSMMAEAEYSAFFLEAFALLDTKVGRERERGG
jgi:hypothetical protein